LSGRVGSKDVGLEDGRIEARLWGWGMGEECVELG